MTAQPLPTPTFPARRLILLAGLAIGAAAVFAAMARFGHAPEWGLLARQPLAVRIHVPAALAALLIGTVQLVGVKGTGVHRVLGWSWVIAMLTVAASSFFIRQINPGAFSWIHLLSGWTFIAVPMAVVAIRRGRVKGHARGMAGAFVGGLVIAGAFAFTPGRLMWEMFLG
ncbi:MAG TPA: DUF2306 domain-containing protein [Brevundimonas sp.]|jgi:uncharacterized membrane protein|uniref:DUF2306 domain-containing protein n=1 Tax=Brevundimonas sp. TaxID=1871086 RepID=UPI002ED81604